MSDIGKIPVKGKCKCGQEIVWVKTKTGRNMPVNVPKFDDGESRHEAITTAIEFNPDYMTSHFATCPFAARFRKPKETIIGDGTTIGGVL